MTRVIDSFTGDYRFLSNFYVETDGLTAEHRFQALKTVDPEEQAAIMMADTPGAAKRLGRACTLREGWDDIRIEVMVRVVTEKFHNDPALMYKLLETGNAELIEGNTWNDTYWGVCNGVGENMLGKILMTLRDAVFEILPEASLDSEAPEA